MGTEPPPFISQIDTTEKFSPRITCRSSAPHHQKEQTDKMENALRTRAMQSHAAKQCKQQEAAYVMIVPEDEFRSSTFGGSSSSLDFDNHHYLGCDLLRNMYEESRALAAASGVTVNAKMPDIAKLYYAVCSPEQASASATMRSHHFGHHY
jgi:hypothetical protein